MTGSFLPGNDRLKVLYVAGNGRSGSTLLDVILGQVPGFFPVGEVRNLWDYGLVEGRPCGCGNPVTECSTWKSIFERGFSGGDAVSPARVASWRERYAQTKRLLPMILRGRGYRDSGDAGIRMYLEVLERLYHAIAATTGARVVVDSSKWPTYARLLDSIPSIDLYVLHLVRDPRACAFSWRRLKEAEPGRYLDVQGPVYTTSYWVVWNPTIRHFFGSRRSRYMFLRYEDFVSAPRDTIDEILRFVDEDETPNPFVSENTVPISPTHTIEGNLARFQRGEIAVRADTEWRRKMSWGSRAVVTSMTWPFLLRYGYWGARNAFAGR